MPVVPVLGSSRALLKRSVSRLRLRQAGIAQEVACIGDYSGAAVSDELMGPDTRRAGDRSRNSADGAAELVSVSCDPTWLKLVRFSRVAG